MTDTEKQIENMGYKIRVIDMLNNYVVYENKKEDQEIILESEHNSDTEEVIEKTFSRKKADYTSALQTAAYSPYSN